MPGAATYLLARTEISPPISFRANRRSDAVPSLVFDNGIHTHKPSRSSFSHAIRTTAVSLPVLVAIQQDHPAERYGTYQYGSSLRYRFFFPKAYYSLLVEVGGERAAVYSLTERVRVSRVRLNNDWHCRRIVLAGERFDACSETALLRSTRRDYVLALYYSSDSRW